MRGKLVALDLSAVKEIIKSPLSASGPVRCMECNVPLNETMGFVLGLLFRLEDGTALVFYVGQSEAIVHCERNHVIPLYFPSMEGLELEWESLVQYFETQEGRDPPTLEHIGTVLPGHSITKES